MATVSDSSVKPTTIIGSDSRFGTTFLSNKYRDKAINGEVLMDKNTGEIYIKRVSDGKIVSFNQNKKMINDLAFDLRLLLLDNKKFVYPSKNDNAFYVVTNYDLAAINNEKIYNLITDDVVISGEPNDVNKLTFKISGGSNGFFCRHTTRDTDKAFIEFLTNQYNLIFKNYTGDNSDYVTESQKLETIEKWERSNAELTFDVIVSKDGVDYPYTNITEYIKMNDDSEILIPDQIYTDLGSFDYATISITGIAYNKLHFMINHKDEFGSIFTDVYNKLMPIDSAVGLTEFIINHFVDDASYVVIHGNESIVGFIDMPHIEQWMTKINKFLGSSKIHISETQPEYACMWFQPTSLD